MVAVGVGHPAKNGVRGVWVPAKQAVREVAFLRLTDTTVFAAAQKSFSGWRGLKRLQQRWHSEDVDCPFEIVAQYPQRQFRFCFSQSLEQESRVGHQPFHRT